jgi:hypothetical protein
LKIIPCQNNFTFNQYKNKNYNLNMGNTQSMKKINYEDMQTIIKNPEIYLIINTLPLNEQSCLIINTISPNEEETIINKLLK